MSSHLSGGNEQENIVTVVATITAFLAVVVGFSGSIHEKPTANARSALTVATREMFKLRLSSLHFPLFEGGFSTEGKE